MIVKGIVILAPLSLPVTVNVVVILSPGKALVPNKVLTVVFDILSLNRKPGVLL